VAVDFVGFLISQLRATRQQTFAAVRHKRNAEELGHQPMPRTVKIDKLLCQRCGYLLSQRDTIDLWPVWSPPMRLFRNSGRQ